MGAFFYPTGVSTGYSGLASYMAGTIANVTGYSGMAAPPVPTGNDGFLQSMADAIMVGVGLQTRSAAAGSVASSVGPTSFTDVPGYSSFNFTAGYAKYYLVHVDVAFFASVLGTTPELVTFQVVTGGGSFSDVGCAVLVPTASVQQNGSFRIPCLFASGANTVKLQWKCSNAGTTLNTSTSSFRAFTIA